MDKNKIGMAVRDFWAMNYPFGQQALIDFICTIKPKVSRIELSELASDILDSITTSRVVGLIEIFLEKKGIEVLD